MEISQATVLDVLDLCGVAVFAASGAVLAIRRKFDVVGLLTLAFVAALGGGVLRDLLLARGVPVAFDDPSYAIVAFITGLAVVPTRNLIERVWRQWLACVNTRKEAAAAMELAYPLALDRPWRTWLSYVNTRKEAAAAMELAYPLALDRPWRT